MREHRSIRKLGKALVCLGRVKTFQGGKQTRVKSSQTDEHPLQETEVREHRKAESWLNLSEKERREERQLMGKVITLVFVSS